MSGQIFFPFPDTVVDFATAATTISSATVLEGWTNVRKFISGEYVVENQSASSGATVTVEFSSRGTYVDAALTLTRVLAASGEVSAQWGGLHQPGADYVRLTVTPDTGSINVRWRRRGVYRGP